MQTHDLHRLFLGLTTAHAADALLRLGISIRCAPAGVQPLWAGTQMTGRARPTRHFGSVDVFLEALEHAEPGDVLVVDNGGRTDEACVGDLIALEAKHEALAGIVIWGLHRDTRELKAIQLPVFSQGALPVGPQRLDEQDADALDWARVGDHTVTRDDFVLGDDDGVLFMPVSRAADIAELATGIRDTELAQATTMNGGASLRNQTRFSEYLRARTSEGTTFRQHLRNLGGAIEE